MSRRPCRVDRADGRSKPNGAPDRPVVQIAKRGAPTSSCGDCHQLDVVNALETIVSDALIWTDPPIRVDYGAKTEWTHQHGAVKRRRAIENESLKPPSSRAVRHSFFDVSGNMHERRRV